MSQSTKRRVIWVPAWRDGKNIFGPWQSSCYQVITNWCRWAPVVNGDFIGFPLQQCQPTCRAQLKSRPALRVRDVGLNQTFTSVEDRNEVCYGMLNCWVPTLLFFSLCCERYMQQLLRLPSKTWTPTKMVWSLARWVAIVSCSSLALECLTYFEITSSIVIRHFCWHI